MKKISIINWRFILVCSFFSLSIFAIAYKIISLQIDDSIFLKNEGKKKYIKYRNINPVRGTIYDRNNFPLAVSIINCSFLDSPFLIKVFFEKDSLILRSSSKEIISLIDINFANSKPLRA